eukprot:GABV01008918.1.p1 GENE.GABV01008918.1~~GABV01008918.1.p1  ORF type:complete len:200 (+),score=64.56 GABV01008918.1:270-869(+)
MCLFPGQTILVACSERALELGRILKALLLVMFINMIFMFITGRFFSGFFCLITALIGWCALRNEAEGYAIMQVMCITIMSGLLFIYSLKDTVDWQFLDQNLDNPSKTTKMIWLISSVVSAFVSLGTLIITKKLYDELRESFNPYDQAAAAQSGGSVPWGGQAQPAAGGSDQSGSSGGGARGNYPSSFQPFAGRGYSLRG